MPKGYALNIGLDIVDPAFYNGDDGALYSPEANAEKMAEIASDKGFGSVKVMRSEKATKSNFVAAMKRYQEELEGGDLLFLSFAGHGGKILNEDVEEMDPEEGEFDETWCFYDGEFSDDCIYQLLSDFKEDVRIFIISDSCHSGSIIKNPDAKKREEKRERLERKEIKASIVLLSGAQENELAYDGDPNGQFTTALLKVWDNGNFVGNFKQFHQDIWYEMEMCQNPNLLMEGKANKAFFEGRPFEI